MSVYAFRPHNGGYLAFVHGEHVGQVTRVAHHVQGLDIKTGWRPSSEHGTLPLERTRQFAARALWDAHQARMRHRSA
jgi:hypothetical protein